MSAAGAIQILLVLFGSLGAGSAAGAGQSRDTAAPASAETTPQAQEERATRPESARPAPGTSAAGSPAARQPTSAAGAGQNAPGSKRVAPRRRSVEQVIGSVPPPAATQTYGPTLTPPALTFRAPPGAAPAPVAGLPAVTSPPPAQLNSCVGNFCTDASGATYTSGTGNAAVNSQGRLCNRVGNTMQCF